MTTKIIRAYELRKGDKFIKQGIRYVVKSSNSNGIIYYPETTKSSAKKLHIGRMSHERVELITLPVKPLHSIAGRG